MTFIQHFYWYHTKLVNTCIYNEVLTPKLQQFNLQLFQLASSTNGNICIDRLQSNRPIHDIACHVLQRLTGKLNRLLLAASQLQSKNYCAATVEKT